MNRGAPMDAISLDEWEFLPDHKSSFMEESNNGHGIAGGKDRLLCGANLVVINMDHFTPASHPSPYDCILDEETKKPLLPPSKDGYAHDPVIEFKDIGVVQTELKQEEIMPKVTELLSSDAEEEEEMIKCPGAKEVDEDEELVEVAPDQCAEEEEGIKTDRMGLEIIGFSVGGLRVSGIGALCSFGVAAATFCIFLLGGRQQQLQNKKHNQKIQFQMYSGDERIQQVVQQASRLNQAMSSVMGGASTRASISFGGSYDGF